MHSFTRSTHDLMPKGDCEPGPEPQSTHTPIMTTPLAATAPKTEPTLATKAYAAQNPRSGLAPFSIERRKPGPKDVHLRIRYCGVCHTDLHFMRNDWGISIYPLV